MNSRLFSMLLLQIAFAFLVQGTIYITKPLPGSTCSGGKSCTVEWLDDGVVPLLSDIRACHVALYNGNQVLIQQINPVDVSVQHALTFTPDPKAGPSSSGYYINFTSVDPVGGSTYNQYSTMFTIDSMTGSFGSPVTSDTAAIPVPSTLTNSHSASATSTSTVGASASSSSGAALTSSSSDTSTSASSSSGSSHSSQLQLQLGKQQQQQCVIGFYDLKYGIDVNHCGGNEPSNHADRDGNQHTASHHCAVGTHVVVAVVVFEQPRPGVVCAGFAGDTLGYTRRTSSLRALLSRPLVRHLTWLSYYVASPVE
ncbi:hypothetical protein L226DRAFT_559951 [Lentinus tigrinus ALCF2SS1-7]|uniref:uncharacterized protein n=1 Tax=Lentinus tigrinus ALCF2SS1-7 TaxID=1328758 RepID=UPI0011663376|nr:hypothetical protein L226DRAFT_559951 [Lentinus tigrinus ALCF2SS1-7]